MIFNHSFVSSIVTTMGNKQKPCKRCGTLFTQNKDNCGRCVKERIFLKNCFRLSTNIVEAEVVFGQGKYTKLKTLCSHGVTQLRNYSSCVANFRQGRGNESFNCTCDTKGRRRATNMKRYSVPNPAQHPAFSAKMVASLFRTKTFTWPSGKETLYQGWENFLYGILLQRFSEDDIVTERDKIQTFAYTNIKGRPAVYFPDAMVGKIAFECKSDRSATLDVNLMLKLEAANNAGFTIELYMFMSPGTYFRHVRTPDNVRVLECPDNILEVGPLLQL